MKKTINILLTLIVATFLISCSHLQERSTTTLSFPVNDYEKTEFNAKIYDEAQFSLSLMLPDGWSTKKQEAAEDEFSLISVFSKYNILNEEKTLVGVVGFNKYEAYEGA